MAMSNYLEEQLINHIFRTNTFPKPSTLAIALLTAAAVDTDTGALTGKEVANSFGYARQSLNPLDGNWKNPALATQGETDNVPAITFGPANGGNWGTVIGVAIVDSATYAGGNLLFYGLLSTSKTVNDGDTFKFNIGDLNIQLD
jgi:hypothetical protein